MIARKIIGRRIVGVRQVRFNARLHGKEMATDVLAIILDNGAELVPVTIETEHGEYAHDFAIRSKAKKEDLCR